MEKIKIGQIGAEHDHAGEIMRTLKKFPEVFDLVGFAVPEGEKIAAPKQYEGVPQMSVEELLATPGLQAVTVETYELNLTKYAKMAVDRGLAVHMDKPGGSELSDYEELIAAAEKHWQLFHIHIETGSDYSAAVLRQWLTLLPGRVAVIHKNNIRDLASLLDVLSQMAAGVTANEALRSLNQDDAEQLARSVALIDLQSKEQDNIITF